MLKVWMIEHGSHECFGDSAPPKLRDDEYVHQVCEHGTIGDDSGKGHLASGVIHAEAQRMLD